MDEAVRDDVEEITRTRRNLIRAFNASDLVGFMSPVADDVVWMGHTGPPAMLGKQAVWKSYQLFFERGPFIPKMSCVSDEVIVSGDWAFDRGTWNVLRTFKGHARRERLRSCYVMIWRRSSEGRWKLARFIWNGSPVPLKRSTTGRAPREARGKRRRS